jgi:hypothetical protein
MGFLGVIITESYEYYSIKNIEKDDKISKLEVAINSLLNKLHKKVK